nr:hypothetical protein [Tanacetum cinerariifolium]
MKKVLKGLVKNQVKEQVSPDLSEMELKKILIEKMEGNKSIQQKEGGEQASASTPSEKATKGAGGSTTGTQSQQQFASESAYAEEPMQTTCQMEVTPLPVYETESKEATLELEDPQELLDSNLLETFLDLGFLEYTNVTTGLSVLLTIGMGSLGGTIVGVAILVKGHTCPTSVNVLLVGFYI